MLNTSQSQVPNKKKNTHTASIQLNDSERVKCEVWTRVMGYHRPTCSFNPGKQSEFEERKWYKISQNSLA